MDAGLARLPAWILGWEQSGRERSSAPWLAGRHPGEYLAVPVQHWLRPSRALVSQPPVGIQAKALLGPRCPGIQRGRTATHTASQPPGCSRLTLQAVPVGAGAGGGGGGGRPHHGGEGALLLDGGDHVDWGEGEDAGGGGGAGAGREGDGGRAQRGAGGHDCSGQRRQSDRGPRSSRVSDVVWGGWAGDSGGRPLPHPAQVVWWRHARKTLRACAGQEPMHTAGQG